MIIFLSNPTDNNSEKYPNNINDFTFEIIFKTKTGNHKNEGVHTNNQVCYFQFFLFKNFNEIKTLKIILQKI